MCQNKYIKNNDTCKDSILYLIGSTVAIQHEDCWAWKHRVTEEASNSDHSGKSHIAKLTKTYYSHPEKPRYCLHAQYA